VLGAGYVTECVQWNTLFNWVTHDDVLEVKR
jgi:hypothetical protein